MTAIQEPAYTYTAGMGATIFFFRVLCRNSTGNLTGLRLSTQLGLSVLMLHYNPRTPPSQIFYLLNVLDAGAGLLGYNYYLAVGKNSSVRAFA